MCQALCHVLQCLGLHPACWRLLRDPASGRRQSEEEAGTDMPCDGCSSPASSVRGDFKMFICQMFTELQILEPTVASFSRKGVS